MLRGSMQQTPLLVSQILSFAAAAHGRREIVSRLVDEPDWRYDWAACAARCGRLARALAGLGVAAGDRVTSLAWNTHRHLELFYAVPGMGAVLHTANPRLGDEQIRYTIDHAGSRVLFYERSFADMVARLRPRLAHVAHFILLDAEGYEPLLAGEDADDGWPSFDEGGAAFLCYTSGTTGDPKGVLYSHRSVVLHALASGLDGALGLGAFDTVMPCQSLYHATAWGVPFVAAINGCKLVLPCDRLDGPSLDTLIRAEGVTFSGGVPTIWTMYLAHLERSGGGVGALRRVVIGGSAVPRAMAETFERRYGVTVRQLWGMTETSPIGVVAAPTPELAAEGPEAAEEILWTRQGRAQFGVEIRIAAEDGAALPRDGATAGRVLIRGPWVIERYYRSDASAIDAEGWFDTGDIGTIDRFGFLRITDRAKDVIKSGGEWISSIDLENVAAACPGVRIAAVVGLPHPKWEERPLLLVEPHEGATVSAEAVLDFLAPQVVRWWLPDAVVIAPVPLTATGKIDKKTIRERYRDHLAASAQDGSAGRDFGLC